MSDLGCVHLNFNSLTLFCSHCDGFINWKTQLSDYNILNTPYGKDIFGEITTAFRQRGIRVGAYVCPSLWNNDKYALKFRTD